MDHGLLVSGCASARTVTTGGCWTGAVSQRLMALTGPHLRPLTAHLTALLTAHLARVPAPSLPHSPPGHIMAHKRHARPQLRPTGLSLFTSSTWDELIEPKTRPQPNGEPSRRGLQRPLPPAPTSSPSNFDVAPLPLPMRS
ncbi:hypothetical protein EDB80DRAFT_686519 [Ilyonectria destructans]|nr:hypothetical protein EDB80DRAFT_686519 [Ilyonectria destructans]